MNDTPDPFIFYEMFDSPGYDICYHGSKTIDELKALCINDPKCIGFNTLGFMKHLIFAKEDFITSHHLKSPGSGIYVHKQRYQDQTANIINNSHVEFDDYIFYKNKLSPGHAHKNLKNRDIYFLKAAADNQPDCVGFDTTGSIKHEIQEPDRMIQIPDVTGGTYVKKSSKKYRIKMLCNWCSSKQVCDEWNVMSKGNYTWNDIEVTWHDDNIDFYVIINKPHPGEYYVPSRTIIFQMEPWCDDPNQHWGVKTWGEWAEPDIHKFLHVRTHRTTYNNCFWQLKTTYSEFSNMVINKTKHNIIASICSDKYFDPGHIKRVDFMRYIESKNDSRVTLDIYNSNNNLNFKSYRGPHPPNNKDHGILPYKYYFMAENNVEHNFMTEKIWEPLICECLCFYWGCPNLSDYIDPRSYIVLDLDDYEASYNIVLEAILNNEWSKRLEYIRREKQKVLNYYNFFPTLERVIKHDFKFNYKPSDSEICYKKYFSQLDNNNQNDIQTVCFIHSCTFKPGDTAMLDDCIVRLIQSGLYTKLDAIYIINLGCKITCTLPHKFKLIHYSDNTHLYEIPTINLIRTFSCIHQDAKILYLHTKGASQNPHGSGFSNILDWKNMMLYWLVDQYQLCLDYLDVFDTVGCNFLQKSDCKPHYSGNFWWTTARYAKCLDPITSGDRHDPEWWLLSGTAKNYCIHDTKINHYWDPYPVAKYDNDLTKNMISSLYSSDRIIKHNMRFKCINLERRPDRRQNVQNILKHVELLEFTDFFDAIDGQKLEPTDEIRKLFTGNDFGAKRGFIGCALSHLTVWKQLLDDPEHDMYLIMEDDFFVHGNFKFQLNLVLDKIDELEYYDIVYLGYHIYKHNLPKHYKKLDNLRDLTLDIHDVSLTIGGLYGYIMTKTGAQKLVDFINQNGIKHGIDYVMFHYADSMNLKHYELLPHIIFSDYVDHARKVDSDIQYNAGSLF